MVSGLKRILLWDYPRAGWQYDIMVGLVTAFIFLTPRSWFQDQPRILEASQLMELPNHAGYLVPPGLVASIEEDRRTAELSRVLTARTGRKQTVADIEPIYDTERNIRFFVVHTRP
ncbi:MAG TPA: hypothetical protein VG345_15495 [Bryobacteraceae bacterium]|nr:hypothetical protein [Bryobacteraceae bacterium]